MASSNTQITSRGGRGLALLAALLGLSACGDDFTPFGELDRLRVLGIRAQNPTLTSSGALQQTTLAALVYSPAQTPITYDWSWCPITGGATTGYACLVDADQLKTMATAAGVNLPADFSLQLSQTATASFSYPLPSATLRAMCDAIGEAELPALATLPKCEQGMDVTIKLTLRQGEREVKATKKVLLRFDPEHMAGKVQNAPNRNPTIGGVFYMPDSDRSRLRPWDALPGPTFTRGEAYAVVVVVPATDAQPYTRYKVQAPDTPVQTRESLSITWLSESGGFEYTRTGYLPEAPESALPELTTNVLTVPDTKDYDKDTTELIFVVRDNRGGQTWIRKQARIR